MIIEAWQLERQREPTDCPPADVPGSDLSVAVDQQRYRHRIDALELS
jgi:hypothetical protein